MKSSLKINKFTQEPRLRRVRLLYFNLFSRHSTYLLLKEKNYKSTHNDKMEIQVVYPLLFCWKMNKKQLFASMWKIETKVFQNTYI